MAPIFQVDLIIYCVGALCRLIPLCRTQIRRQQIQELPEIEPEERLNASYIRRKI